MFTEATMNKERNMVTFELAGTQIRASTSHIGELIAKLGALRADMLPTVDPKPPRTLQPSATAITVAPAPPDEVVLAMRHPGYGWIALRLSNDKAKTDLVDLVERNTRKAMH